MGIPSLIKCFFVVECVIFGPFALHHYLACAHTKQLEHLSGNRVGWLVLHSWRSRWMAEAIIDSA